PYLFRGYLDEDLNSGAFDEDGFFRTGDLGFIDEDGYVTLTGLLKDLIIRKGENISPLEVESLLTLHPKIAETAVVGVPDQERGELAVAFLVPHDLTDPLSFDEMMSHLLVSGLAQYKVPERLRTVLNLPKNTMNKVIKSELRTWQ